MLTVKSTWQSNQNSQINLSLSVAIRRFLFKIHTLHILYITPKLESKIKAKQLSVSGKNLKRFLSECTRIWTWTLQSSCSCTPGTLGPTLFCASLGDSCLTGFLESGEKTNQSHWFWDQYICIETKVKELCSFCSFRFRRCHLSLFSLFFFIGWEPLSFPSSSVLDR